MAKSKAPPRGKNRDNGRRVKKKISVLNTEKIDYVDFKDINLLRRFMSDRAKIRSRRVTGNNAQQQREVARAIKNAREMALVPYTNRVTTQRGSGRGRGGDRDDRGDRGESRSDGPPPRPTAPPPTVEGAGGEEFVDQQAMGDQIEATAVAEETAAAEATTTGDEQ